MVRTLKRLGYAVGIVSGGFTAVTDDLAGIDDRAAGLAAIARLDNDHEKRLLAALNRYPEVLRVAAAQSAPSTADATKGLPMIQPRAACAMWREALSAR